MIMKVPAPDPSGHFALLEHPLHLWGILLGIQCRHAPHAVLVSHFVVSPVGVSFSHSAPGAEFVLF